MEAPWLSINTLGDKENTAYVHNTILFRYKET